MNNQVVNRDRHLGQVVRASFDGQLPESRGHQVTGTDEAEMHSGNIEQEHFDGHHPQRKTHVTIIGWHRFLL